MVRKFDNLDTRIVRLLTLSRFTNDVDIVGVIADAIHDSICQSVFTIADLAVPVFLLELRAEDGLKIA